MDYSKYPKYVPLEKMIARDNIPSWLVVHCSASDYDDFKSIQRYHITDSSHFWENIGYHYVIERSGKLVAGRPERYHGAHVAELDTDGVKMNLKSIGICLCGDFETKMPSAAQVETLKKLLIEKSNQYNIPPERIKPHRYWAKYKTCFGSKIPDDWAAKLVIPAPPVVEPPQPAPQPNCDAAIKADRKSTLRKVADFINSLMQ